MRTIELDRWALIPGPEGLIEVISSQEIVELALYEPQAVAERMLAFDGVELLHGPESTWWDWRACLRCEDCRVEFDFSLLEFEPPRETAWGGSQLSGRCGLDLWVMFFEDLRAAFPGVYMHNDDTEVYGPESFIELLR